MRARIAKALAGVLTSLRGPMTETKALTILLVFVVALFAYDTQKVLSTASATRNNQAALTQDQMAGCLRTSARTAAGLNHNYFNYRSEVDLAPPGAIPPGSSAGAIKSIGVLQARAVEDYQAARVDARSIDVQDAGLINVNTFFGYDPTPRNWVLKADFSCRKAYH